jgi:L,D-transpeptidase catalytic domain
MLLKTGLAVFLTFLAFLTTLYFFWYKPKFKIPRKEVPYTSSKRYSANFAKLTAKVETLKSFTRKNNYNEEVCFLIDMSIESGKKRFFVFNIKNDSILLSGLAAHGSCDDGFKIKPSFSNKVNSGCSCLGKFKIGNSYAGNFGIAYKLYGLDSSNSNAFARNVVLHSYGCVPEQETDPLPICNSRGCPMVAPGFLEKLKPVINQSKKPVLLWILD